MPTECTHGTNSPSAPSASSAPWPMRVMIRMFATTQARVGQLDADVGDRRAERAHRERHDVHRAPLHAAVEQAGELVAHLDGVGPVVRRTGVVLVLRADERAVLDARDVARVRAREVGVRALGVGQARERARVHELLGEAVVLLRRAVAPVDLASASSGRRSRRPRQAASHSSSARSSGSRVAPPVLTFGRADCRAISKSTAPSLHETLVRDVAQARRGRNFRPGRTGFLQAYRGAFASQGRRVDAPPHAPVIPPGSPRRHRPAAMSHVHDRERFPHART